MSAVPKTQTVLDSAEHAAHAALAASKARGAKGMVDRATGIEWLKGKGLASEWPAPTPAKPAPKYEPIGNPTLAYVNQKRGEVKPRSRAVTTCIEDVVAEEVEWLWPGRIPLSTVSIIGGDPGAGKSTLTGALTTTVSIGGCWPDQQGEKTPAGAVLILTAEENLANAVRPRLDKMGADLSKVHILTTIEHEDGGLSPFSLTRDIPLLEEAIERIGGVRLVIIDPIGSYVGGADSHNDAEVRDAVNPLFKLAEKHKLAVLLVAHLNKGSGTNVLYRFSGSIAFAALSRMAWFLSKHPHDKFRRLLSYVKGNPPDALTTGIAFGFAHGQMLWDAEPVDWQADEVARMLAAESDKLRAGTAKGPAPEKTVKAEEFVAQALAHGPTSLLAVLEKAQLVGIKDSTMRAAVKKLLARDAVVRYRSDDGKRVILKFPEAAGPLADQQALPGLE
jgi:putative DNA primase/helicase